MDPADLIVSRRDANQLLLAVGLFAVTFIAFGICVLNDWFAASFVVMPPGMVGVLMMNNLGKKASRRLTPERIGTFARWRFDSKVGQQWLRLDVLRYALKVRRGAT